MFNNDSCWMLKEKKEWNGTPLSKGVPFHKRIKYISSEKLRISFFYNSYKSWGRLELAAGDQSNLVDQVSQKAVSKFNAYLPFSLICNYNNDNKQ